MRVAKTTLLMLCLLAAGCGDFFQDPGAGGGTATTQGDPRFIADCSNGPLEAPATPMPIA